MDFAGAVGGDDDDRRVRRLHGAELRDGDLEVREDFQQVRLERFVGAVELVDQQHRRSADIRLQRLQQRPLDQIAVGENVRGQLLAIGIAGGFRQANGDHLRRAVPLVDGGGDIEPLIALQADQLASERRRQDLGDLGLADAGLAFQEQRPAHLQGEEGDGRQRALGEIAARLQQVEHCIDGCRNGRCGHLSANVGRPSSFKGLVSFLGSRSFDRPAGQDRNQVGAVFGTAMYIAI